MSALAQHLHAAGCDVYGYDKTPSRVTADLEALGVSIVFDQAVTAIPTACLNTDTQIIYTPAIPDKHLQLHYFKTHNFKLQKRAALLGDLTKASITLAVAGTHGKTTTSAILAHLLHTADCAFTAFIGGVMKAHQSNYLNFGTDYCVVEADEYDRSFLHLFPKYACVTSMDADHLDIYETTENIQDTYAQFIAQVSEAVIAPKELGLGTVHYAVQEQAHFSAHNIICTPKGYTFTLKTPKASYADVHFPMLGAHNINNALAAVALASQIGIPTATLVAGLASFKGIDRRMNIHHVDDKILVDDYAHHPTEIKAVYSSLKNHFPKAKLGVVFQPHLFSRTRDFWKDFTTTLAQFDTVALMDIYPARELPLPGITAATLLDALPHGNKQIITDKALKTYIKNSSTDVIALLGAGDIGVTIKTLVKS